MHSSTVISTIPACTNWRFHLYTFLSAFYEHYALYLIYGIRFIFQFFSRLPEALWRHCITHTRIRKYVCMWFSSKRPKNPRYFSFKFESYDLSSVYKQNGTLNVWITSIRLVYAIVYSCTLWHMRNVYVWGWWKYIFFPKCYGKKKILSSCNISFELCLNALCTCEFSIIFLL